MSTLCAEAARVFCARSFCFTADGTPLHIRLDDGQFYFYTEQVRHLATPPPLLGDHPSHFYTQPSKALDNHPSSLPLPPAASRQSSSPALRTTTPHHLSSRRMAPLLNAVAGQPPRSAAPLLLQWQSSLSLPTQIGASPHASKAPLFTTCPHLFSPPRFTAHQRISSPNLRSSPRSPLPLVVLSLAPAVESLATALVLPLATTLKPLVNRLDYLLLQH